MEVVNTTNTIELQNGGVNDVVIKKVNVSSVSADPFIRKRNFEAPNPANFLAWVTTVKILVAGGREYTIPLELVSNQPTWFNPAWTTPAQLQAGVNQAMADIQSWL